LRLIFVVSQKTTRLQNSTTGCFYLSQTKASDDDDDAVLHAQTA